MLFQRIARKTCTSLLENYFITFVELLSKELHNTRMFHDRQTRRMANCLKASYWSPYLLVVTFKSKGLLNSLPFRSKCHVCQIYRDEYAYLRSFSLFTLNQACQTGGPIACQCGPKLSSINKNSLKDIVI